MAKRQPAGEDDVMERWWTRVRGVLACVALASGVAACGGGTEENGGGVTPVGDVVTLDGVLAEDAPVPCGGCADGLHCDRATNLCLACLRDDHCAEGERCIGGACAVLVCEPGDTTCTDEVERHCNELGTAWDELPCSGDRVCVGDLCRDKICRPGAIRCQSGLVLTCAPTGLSETSARCDDGELCVEGEGCTFVRHDLMVIVDTSGSMRRIPEDPNEPAWTEPWPVCESMLEPQTRIGIARKLFRRLLDEEDAILARSDFALMRFPQFVDGIFVEDPADPGGTACKFGLWQSGSGEALTGDDDSHATGTGEPEADWFAGVLWQALMVPDPRVPGFAGLGVDVRKEAILAYVDGQEVAVPGADAVPCQLANGTLQCGLDRPCLGPEGARTCHDVVNPELRAMGQTPIGRTLFYASEYYRRFVHVEGRPCATDADCGSSNYTCADGACSDPLARCRKTVIVLITDGTETPIPEDEFFRARVQAKRLHYGLGCADAADCLNGATCEAVRSCKADADGAIGVVCDTDQDCCRTEVPCGVTCAEAVDVCATPDLLVQAREDAATAAAVVFVDPEGVQRIEDAAGVPLPMTVHVVDVAGGSEQNERVALLGGGALLLHSLYDLDALIADLRSVFDIKAGSQCLVE